MKESYPGYEMLTEDAKKSLVTWRELITKACENDDESFEDLVITLSDADLDEVFCSSFGEPEGKPFTAWGKNWVYFPATNEVGEEWVGQVPRNPCDIPTGHVWSW